MPETITVITVTIVERRSPKTSPRLTVVLAASCARAKTGQNTAAATAITAATRPGAPTRARGSTRTHAAASARTMHGPHVAIGRR